jgi:hypothetical protein
MRSAGPGLNALQGSTELGCPRDAGDIQHNVNRHVVAVPKMLAGRPIDHVSLEVAGYLSGAVVRIVAVYP